MVVMKWVTTAAAVCVMISNYLSEWSPVCVAGQSSIFEEVGGGGDEVVILLLHQNGSLLKPEFYGTTKTWKASIRVYMHFHHPYSQTTGILEIRRYILKEKNVFPESAIVLLFKSVNKWEKYRSSPRNSVTKQKHWPGQRSVKMICPLLLFIFPPNYLL